MIVRTTRAKVGHRQAPAKPKGPPQGGPFGFGRVHDDDRPELATQARPRSLTPEQLVDESPQGLSRVIRAALLAKTLDVVPGVRILEDVPNALHDKVRIRQVVRHQRRAGSEILDSGGGTKLVQRTGDGNDGRSRRGCFAERADAGRGDERLAASPGSQKLPKRYPRIDEEILRKAGGCRVASHRLGQDCDDLAVDE